MPRGRPSLPPLTLPPDVLQRYVGGELSTAQIAALWGVSRSRVRAALHAAGVLLGRGARPRNNPTQDDIIRLGLENGHKMAEIGRKLGLTRQRIQQIAAGLGLRKKWK